MVGVEEETNSQPRLMFWHFNLKRAAILASI